tara:strand:+ start:40 stop:1113 length:1074 start_codon:yes stop_codon:yes gene_type:complete
MRKFLLTNYIIIIFTSFVFIFISFTKCFGEENVFTINKVEVKGGIDLNFSREKYLNKAFLISFNTLMNKILLTRDLEKVGNINLQDIKNLIKNFQVTEESFSQNIYQAKIKIIFNEIKTKKFLARKNISFSQPENISAVFYPLLYINDEIQEFNKNFFYRNWNEIEIENELINFILPIEDLDDISRISRMKNNIENLNVDHLVSKYNIKNYVFALMDYQDEKLNIYLKTNFKNNKVSKNISHKISNINDDLALNEILKDLKLRITDLWKEENLVNLLMPLSIKVKFEQANIQDLNNLRNTFYKISIIDNYTLEEFNVNNSFFKIYYYGNPKKLRSELLKFKYQLKNEQGFWQLYLNE